MKTKNVREVAFEVLLKIENEEAYSNLLVNSVIKQRTVNEKDIGLFTEIVYGTVQRKKTLDFFLTQFLLKKVKKKDEWVLTLLRMSLYQMVYLERIPDRAIIYEAVQIAKKRGHRGLASMVNGILRNVQRKGLPAFDTIQDKVEQLSVTYSHPTWLVAQWIKQYGMDTTKNICEANLERPHVTARVNAIETSVAEVIERLETEGVLAQQGKLSIDAIEVRDGNLFETDVFKRGLVTVQDESSMLVGRAVNPQKGEIVLDCCAAPGGKTTHLAELMNDEGEIIALDIHEHKVSLIEQQIERLQLSNVKTQVLDAREAYRNFPNESFDRILVDAPCTGFGVLRRKPDIKWTKTEQDVVEMSRIQQQILDSVAPLLKKGGTLIYSTCTIEARENEQIIHTFLKKHTDFIRDDRLCERLPKKLSPYSEAERGEVQILPHYFQSDGFFIAALRKK